jgi:hypothetical protein
VVTESCHEAQYMIMIMQIPDPVCLLCSIYMYMKGAVLSRYPYCGPASSGQGHQIM